MCGLKVQRQECVDWEETGRQERSNVCSPQLRKILSEADRAVRWEAGDVGDPIADRLSGQRKALLVRIWDRRDLTQPGKYSDSGWGTAELWIDHYLGKETVRFIPLLPTF